MNRKNKNRLYNTIGTLVLIISIILGLYVGGWIMFIQPIINVAKAFDSGVLTGSMIITSIVKCIFASPVGGFIYFIGNLICSVLLMLSTDYT